MNVLFIPKVREYAMHLIRILYEDGYFGLEENAQKYVDDLIFDIEKHLPACLHEPAPKHFDKYGKGMKYAIFRKNRRTTWYAFFKTYRKNGETFYTVRYLANNHVIAKYL
jgi:hypothetical protein